MTVATADAGYVSRPEEALDRIFAQPAFGADPVDVRFEAAHTLYSTWWSSVDTSGDLGALFYGAVPEPGSAALAAFRLALAACAVGRRRLSSNTDERGVRIP